MCRTGSHVTACELAALTHPGTQCLSKHTYRPLTPHRKLGALIIPAPHVTIRKHKCEQSNEVTCPRLHRAQSSRSECPWPQRGDAF